jgi:hypothetical protein
MRIMNRHPKFAMKSTVDKLLKFLARKVVILLLTLVVLPTITAQAKTTDEVWQRRNYLIELKKDGTFTNTDSLLSAFSRGEWKQSNTHLILYADSLYDSLTIHAATTTKISLATRDGRTLTFHTPEVYNNTGFSFESLWKGLLGIITLLLFGYLFSADRKSIRWDQVLKGYFFANYLSVTHTQSSLCRRCL